MFAKVHPAKDVQSGNTGSCHDLYTICRKKVIQVLPSFLIPIMMSVLKKL